MRGLKYRLVSSYTLRKGDPARTNTDVVVIGVTGDRSKPRVAPGGEAVAAAYGRRFGALLASEAFEPTAGTAIRLRTDDTVRASTLVVVGMGAGTDPDHVAIRRAAGVAARNLGNSGSVALALPARDEVEVRAVVEGFSSGGTGTDGATDVSILTDVARRQDVRGALERAEVVEELLATARDWVNEPPNLLTPLALAEAAVELGKGSTVSTEVYDADRLAELRCGGILAVGLSSANHPCLLRLHHEPPKGVEPVARIALVGKGITYDSGGLTIKPGSSMATMKFDMAGAAAVIATIHAAARLELPVEIVAWAPLAENMISGTAMRPGDVITAYDGTTIEIANTDAEGRLLLADALALARESSPDAIVEISTLTGLCVTALGHKVAGLFGSDDQVAAVRAAADAAGELVWPLPVPDHIVRAVRDTTMADLLQHNWVRWGSSSFAAAFLRHFAGDTPFAHIDIAGPAWNGGEAWGDVPAGGTGFGVRTMVQYLIDLSESR